MSKSILVFERKCVQKNTTYSKILYQGIMHSFDCKSLAPTATCFKGVPFLMSKDK